MASDWLESLVICVQCVVVVMQRSKAAVSVEVKQVIGALCRLLAATGLEAVPTPEIFRLAKFGGGAEVVGSLSVFHVMVECNFIFSRSVLNLST